MSITWYSSLSLRPLRPPREAGLGEPEPEVFLPTVHRKNVLIRVIVTLPILLYGVNERIGSHASADRRQKRQTRWVGALVGGEGSGRGLAVSGRSIVGSHLFSASRRR